ncbi:MAG: hypothetical protein COV08_01415 [Candidatus Vogelbacteria bacterium CG10_big_fil_rev_8_21_14_0_10_49_38]|uniref:Uncharacterized protein n=1 Tax=Candidatus Vogelbacteria bacterium CG10_big_fil_rev_8_21_14_0_10_49_38 TaxID=1975043 RepID=A0A2H0RHT1_9BACT|nr:MAG: hypothetical protein BK006_01430 [bacterium CG10_49_38]PIR46058.1 MAG: hypothetical protein COV08_01415 [Candidatus Vogelbacteria bacterium CG10_big_fil_rev_8_21_14_0_10_49_38]
MSEQKMKYARLDLGTIEAVFNKLGGMEGAHAFLRDELQVCKPTRLWREEDGVIYFSVSSDGTEGVDWIKRLEAGGFRVGDYAKQVLRRPDLPCRPAGFKPTSGVTTEIAVLKGMLFGDRDFTTSNIRDLATTRRKLITPNAEVSCLILEKFTDREIEAMGLLSTVVMHEPINDSDGDPSLLGAHRLDEGRWLVAYDDKLDYSWSRDYGFAFAVSQALSTE